jgi:dimethylaniline monooxygenase (N-oxide forming)
METTHRVCVIGAGIAGLVTAKVLNQDGFDVTVFEREPTLGGVWATSRTYPGLRANNPRESYAFADFPYPRTADDFPTAEQVRAYLESYADKFGVRSLIRFSTEVVSVSRQPRTRDSVGRFRAGIRLASAPGMEERLDFGSVAVCSGVFSEPHIPEIAGREQFSGKVFHSSQFVDQEQVSGRRVVVVGAGKSALDCAAAAAERASSCTLLLRAPHWMMPRYFFGLVRFDRLALTKFAELFIPYHRESRVEALLHGLGKPLVGLWWRGLTRLLRAHLRMPPALVPDLPMPIGFENLGVGGEFYESLRRGRVQPKRGQVSAFAGPTTISLDTGEHLEADVIIFATGWRQELPFLDQDLRSQIQRDGVFRLYRHILPSTESHIGFVGYASSTACQLTSEIAAHWLSQCFRGELALPSVAEMEQEISRVRRWVGEILPARPEGYFIGPFVAHYVEELLRDMRLPTLRTRNLFKEYFAPLWPDRYADVTAERRRMRASIVPAAQPGAAPAAERPS